MTVSVKARDLDKDYCREQLLTHYLREGQRVYCVLRSVSASGMSRQISLLIGEGDEVRDITYYAAGALGESLHETRGRRSIRVNGVGMDMGFHLVESLSYALFKNGNSLRHEWI